MYDEDDQAIMSWLLLRYQYQVLVILVFQLVAS